MYTNNTGSEASTFCCTQAVPSYVGNDYYCEAGVDVDPVAEWFTNDPLWDGQMCGLLPVCNKITAITLALRGHVVATLVYLGSKRFYQLVLQEVF